MRVFLVLLLCLSGAAIFKALSDTPAFSPAARKETVLGDWRIPEGPAMYDPGTYAFQRGYGFLAADGVITAETEAPDEIASLEVSMQRAETARDALLEAVFLDPGNAYAWASLGWAEAQLAEDEAALAALRVSWQVAPNNRILADRRLGLVGTLTTPDLQIITLEPPDMTAIQRDIEALTRYDRGSLRFHMELNPHLAETAPPEF